MNYSSRGPIDSPFSDYFVRVTHPPDFYLSPYQFAFRYRLVDHATISTCCPEPLPAVETVREGLLHSNLGFDFTGGHFP